MICIPNFHRFYLITAYCVPMLRVLEFNELVKRTEKQYHVYYTRGELRAVMGKYLTCWCYISLTIWPHRKRFCFERLQSSPRVLYQNSVFVDASSPLQLQLLLALLKQLLILKKVIDALDL